jgi:hypothetical protein
MFLDRLQPGDDRAGKCFRRTRGIGRIHRLIGDVLGQYGEGGPGGADRRRAQPFALQRDQRMARRAQVDRP